MNKTGFKSLITAVCLLLAFSQNIRAESGVANDPSQNPFSPRSLGMGGLSVNFADDANGIFANPAGLAGAQFPQLTSCSRNIMMDETQYLLGGLAVPTDWGVFGLGYIGLGTGGSLPTILDPATGRVIQDPSLEAGSYSNSVLALSYARELKTPLKIAVGGNLKFFNQSLSGGGINDTGTGIGVDLGASYRALPWLTAGAVIQDIIGGSIKWSGSEDKLGGYYKLGAAVRVLGPSGEALYENKQPLTAGLDIDLPNGVLASGNSPLFHLGCEYAPIKYVTLRAGLNQENTGTALTLGLGLVNSGFRFDYAFEQRPGLPGDNPHYFSLSYIGERVLTYARKLKAKYGHLNFIFPYDRSITDKDSVTVRAEVWGERVVDQKRIWTVTGISATYDAFDVTVPEKLAGVSLNGNKLEQQGTIESVQTLKEGRNVLQLSSTTSPEVFGDKTIPGRVDTAEVRVLKITPFTDTPISHWAIEPVSLTVILGLVNGYPDNSFRPEKGITRAELVTLLVKSIGLRQDILDAYATTEVFKDVKRKHWAAKYIAYGSSIKYVTGYPGGRFLPNKVLTRAEGVAILSRYAEAAVSAEGTAEAAPFPDLKAGFWANKNIAAAKSAGMLKFLENKDFKPSEPFSRAEACDVLYRVPAIQKKVNEYWETGIISAGR